VPITEGAESAGSTRQRRTIIYSSSSAPSSSPSSPTAFEENVSRPHTTGGSTVSIQVSRGEGGRGAEVVETSEKGVGRSIAKSFPSMNKYASNQSARSSPVPLATIKRPYTAPELSLNSALQPSVAEGLAGTGSFQPGAVDEHNPRYVFISYAKGCKNETHVHMIAAHLKKRGYNIYCDEGSVDLKMPPAKAAELDQAAVVVRSRTLFFIALGIILILILLRI